METCGSSRYNQDSQGHSYSSISPLVSSSCPVCLLCCARLLLITPSWWPLTEQSEQKSIKVHTSLSEKPLVLIGLTWSIFQTLLHLSGQRCSYLNQMTRYCSRSSSVARREGLLWATDSNTLETPSVPSSLYFNSFCSKTRSNNKIHVISFGSFSISGIYWMLPCSRCSLGFESSCEQAGSCLRVFPFITGTSFLRSLPSAVSSAPFPPLLYQSAVPALEDGPTPCLSPVLSMQFHVTSLVQVGCPFPPAPPSTRLILRTQVSHLDGASPDCLYDVVVPPLHSRSTAGPTQSSHTFHQVQCSGHWQACIL